MYYMPYRLSWYLSHLCSREWVSPSVAWNSRISVEKGSFYRGRKYILKRIPAGNTVNAWHITKMTGNSFSILRKNKPKAKPVSNYFKAFLCLLDENLRFYNKGRKLETELTGLQSLRKGINICFWSFAQESLQLIIWIENILVCFHRSISSKFG